MPILIDLAQQILDVSGNKPNYTHALMAVLEVATDHEHPYANNELSDAIYVTMIMKKNFLNNKIYYFTL